MDKNARYTALANDLIGRLEDKSASIAIFGLGYVGLPLAITFARAGFAVTGYDIDPQKPAKIRRGVSYLNTVPAGIIADAVNEHGLVATDDVTLAVKADVLIICVPTPLSRHREPDISYISGTLDQIAPYLRRGHVISLESTTYPGTTEEVIQPRVEEAGLVPGEDVFLVYSPEREDPGNQDFNTSNTPKVVGGINEQSLAIGTTLYGNAVNTVVPVGSLAVAEAVKLTENIFRAVNIAMVNELKILYDRMGLDVWDVIEAAKTKPFGYMPFYPGPGLGGHCIPIDPFYLTWKAREYGIATRFIELAGEINHAMPDYVLRKLKDGLDSKSGRTLNGSRVLVVGVAYKKNVDDTRESPALEIMRLILEAGAKLDYIDPFVPELPKTRRFPWLGGMRSIATEDVARGDYAAAVICTDHDSIDYAELLRHCGLVVDTRNATKDLFENRERIVKA